MCVCVEKGGGGGGKENTWMTSVAIVRSLECYRPADERNGTKSVQQICYLRTNNETCVSFNIFCNSPRYALYRN